MTEDALGSVRAITNSFGEVKARRDFLPFGEELFAGIGNRTTANKYSANNDDTRKKFATYQRDAETGLDYAQSRYYSPMQGRFTSSDEFKGGPDELFDFEDDASDNPTFYADLENPQSLNKYQYAYNNPYKYNDPNGHCPICIGAVIVFAILTAPDYANAPSRRDTREGRVYKSNRGAGVVLGLIPGARAVGLTRAGASTAIRTGGRTTVRASVRNTPKATKQATKQIAKQPAKRKIIKGYTKHGLNQAIGRNGGRGVKAKTILNTARNPGKVRLQTRNGRQSVKFLRGSGKNKSSLVLSGEGRVITTTGKARGPQIRSQGTNRRSGSGSAQRKANKRGFSYNPNVIR